MATFRNASFERLVQRVLKRTAATLRDEEIPFCLIGSVAVWARGGPEASKDLDFGICERDAVAAAEALERVGMRIEIPPEDWLIKAWDAPPGEEESLLVDLVYGASGLEISDEVIARADELDVLAHRMPVMSATDIPRRCFSSTTSTGRAISLASVGFIPCSLMVGVSLGRSAALHRRTSQGMQAAGGGGERSGRSRAPVAHQLRLVRR
mgnify:CR=1 FL=1